MEDWKKLSEATQNKDLNIKEFLTRSEGPQLFTTSLNDMLIQAAQPELPDTWNLLYNTININRRDIRFPSIRGVNPDLVPELAEIPLVQHQFTSVTVEPQKFGMRIGISSEMIEDNEVGLIGWRTREVGRSHRELLRREAFKALSFNSTGAVTSTGAVGIRNHGIFYPQNGYTNVVSGTDISWEQMIDRAMTRLKNQTITIGDQVVQFPVMPDTIVANPHHEMAIRKVLNAGITVVATGAVGAGGNNVNVAGTNVFQGSLRTQIYDPTIPTAQAFILQSKRGLAYVQRSPLAVDDFDNRQFDATELKTRARYLHAVVEERFIADIQFTA